MKEYEDKQYHTRDDLGKVLTGPKNITINNMKRGKGSTTTGHLFGAYPYQGTPHDLPRELDSKQRMEHKAKIHKPFHGTSNPNATFTPDYLAYHNEGDAYKPKMDETQYRSKTTQKWTYNNANKKSFYGTFSEFPHYIEQGPKQKEALKHEPVWK